MPGKYREKNNDYYIKVESEAKKLKERYFIVSSGCRGFLTIKLLNFDSLKWKFRSFIIYITGVYCIFTIFVAFEVPFSKKFF